MQQHTQRRSHAVVLVGLLVLFSVGALSVPASSTATLTDTDGTVVSLDHPETVSPDGGFEVVVETTASAGTVLAVDPDGFAVNVSTDAADAVRITAERIEFLDVSAGGSTYTIAVDVDGGTNGDTAAITAWVNAETQADADATATSSIELVDAGEGSGGGTSPSDTDTAATDPSSDSTDHESDPVDSTDDREADSVDDGEIDSVDEEANSTDDEESTETDDDIPGFGVLTAVVTLLASAIIVRCLP